MRRLLSAGGVSPAPVQPELPIWMGYQGPQGARRAGLLGERLLTPDARNWAPYRDGLLAAGHDPASGLMAGSVNAWVTDDPEEDWPAVRAHLAYQLDSYNQHSVQGTDRPVPGPVDPDRIRRNTPKRQSYFWCETPEVVAANVKAFVAGAPVDTVFLWASLPGMPEEMAVRHVQAVCTKLVPLLADHQPAADTTAAEAPAP